MNKPKHISIEVQEHGSDFSGTYFSQDIVYTADVTHVQYGKDTSVRNSSGIAPIRTLQLLTVGIAELLKTIRDESPETAIRLYNGIGSELSRVVHSGENHECINCGKCTAESLESGDFTEEQRASLSALSRDPKYARKQ